MRLIRAEMGGACVGNINNAQVSLQKLVQYGHKHTKFIFGFFSAAQNDGERVV